MPELVPVLDRYAGHAVGLAGRDEQAGLAHLGRPFAYGRGFAILVVARHLLETCDTVDEAVDGQRPLPVAVP